MSDSLTDTDAPTGDEPGGVGRTDEVAAPGPFDDLAGDAPIETAATAATSGEAGETDGDDPHAEFWRAADERSGPARSLWQRFWSMPVEAYVSLFVVGISVVFVFAQLHPNEILSDTTPAGGDMGAHVWAPAYLRDHLLPKGRLTGWTPDWYAGFPAFQFYMIIPSLLIALLSYVMPYGIAFKLVAVSGVVTLPVAAYAFGRLSRLPFPSPPLLAVGATVFLFDRSFSIYGGNIPSTLAGEFAFSISLSLALVYLGVVARGLETGKHRGWAALLLALTGLCHLIPFIFVIVATVIWLVLRPAPGRLQVLYVAGPLGALAGIAAASRYGEIASVPLAALAGGALGALVWASWKRLWYLVSVGAVGGALAAFWMLPFWVQHGYMNDMGWEKIETYGKYLWDRDKLDPQLVNSPDLKWTIALAAVGLLLSLVYRRRAGVFLAITAVVFAILFVELPEGRLWNARLLPFYYLSLYLLAAVGVGELGRLLSALFAPDINRPLRAVRGATPIVGLAVGLTAIAMPLQIIPFGSVQDDGSFRLLFLSTKDKSFIDSWSKWNFQGYEGFDTTEVKDAAGQVVRVEKKYNKSYPEYRDIVLTMARLGEERGCGRAMWEHEEQHDRYGTPMALMLLPFWTDGCIGSMEGLYFEASTTTPYHFINQDELSHGPSNAQRDLPYGSGPPTRADFELGIEHLELTGVKYYMAISETTKDFAAQHPSLTRIATSGPWEVYEVADSALVTALPFQPAVLTGQELVGREWQDTAVCWYVNKSSWDVLLAADGPPEWQRVSRTVHPDEDATPAEACQPEQGWRWFASDGGPELRTQRHAAVTNIVTDDDTISFDVSEPGVPVLVKASYFPNWKVSGATGPYRVAPNFMVVVPTENHVELQYGWTGVDLFSWLLTVAGIVGLVLLFRRPSLEVPPPRSYWGKAERPDLYPTEPSDLRFDHEGAELDLVGIGLPVSGGWGAPRAEDRWPGTAGAPGAPGDTWPPGSWPPAADPPRPPDEVFADPLGELAGASEPPAAHGSEPELASEPPTDAGSDGVDAPP